MSLELIDLNVDHEAFGCGWRRFIVCERGRLHVSLIEMSTGYHARLPLETLRGGKPVVDPDWRRVERRLRKLRKRARRYGMRLSTARIKRVEAEIREGV